MAELPLYSMLCYLPERIARAVARLPEEAAFNASEIRLRLNAPATVTLGQKNCFFDREGNPCRPPFALCATEGEMEECIARLTQSSLYRFDDCVAQGYIPLPCGGRAGLCGDAVLSGGAIASFSKITAINLRIPRQISDFARPLIEKFAADGLKGTLVCSPPAMGKTTFLKSAAAMLSKGIGIEPTRVGIVDERCELAQRGFDFGIADIIKNARKSEGIMLLTRTMAPQVIICDEIAPQEAEPLLECFNSGVCIIASAHCTHPNELRRRGRMASLLDSGVFSLGVILGCNGGYCLEIKELE